MTVFGHIFFEPLWGLGFVSRTGFFLDGERVGRLIHRNGKYRDIILIQSKGEFKIYVLIVALNPPPFFKINNRLNNEICLRHTND